MRNKRIISIEKARNNSHYILDMEAKNDCGESVILRYSFQARSCRPCYGLMIDVMTSLPVPTKRFDEFCLDFVALDNRSERSKTEMIASFRKQVCG